MLIKSLKLYNFRNLENGVYPLPFGISCVVGENGQGKTNLIEAISLLSHTRSFRTSELSELHTWGKDECSVFANAQVQGEEVEIGISIESGSRKSFIGGKQADSVMSLIGLLSCVAFSPSDLSLVKGAPIGRRRFFDRHVADNDPSALKAYIDYQRALRQKNAVLKGMRVEARAIETWNAVLAEPAAKIINARLKLLRELEARLAAVSSSLFNDAGAITLKTKGPSAHLIETKAGDEVSAQEVLTHLNDAIQREISKQGSSVGPHRDDIVPFLFHKDARAFASQGQSRGIVLALKLAVIELIETRRKDSPVVLLDDVDSELDEARRAAIFNAIFEKPRQVLITATEFRLPQPLKTKVEGVLRIHNGTLQKDDFR